MHSVGTGDRLPADCQDKKRVREVQRVIELAELGIKPYRVIGLSPSLAQLVEQGITTSRVKG